MNKVWIGHIVIIFVACSYHAEGSSVNKFLRLTLNQKIALDKFRARVIGKIALHHDYMKEDVYLIRWLRAAGYNVGQAERMLKDNLKWRKDVNVDSIMDEDWSEFLEKYPYYLGTLAKNGEPIYMGNVGEWDIRAAAVSGKMARLIRYQIRIGEEALIMLNKMMAEGKNVTQFQFLVNLDGFNLIEHGCPQCMSFYIGLITQYEQHFPNYMENIIIINTPPIFEVVLNVIRPLMHSMTRDIFRVYGLNKSVWRKALLEIADKSQLLPEFGGTYIKADWN